LWDDDLDGQIALVRDPEIEEEMGMTFEGLEIEVHVDPYNDVGSDLHLMGILRPVSGNKPPWPKAFGEIDVHGIKVHITGYGTDGRLMLMVEGGFTFHQKFRKKVDFSIKIGEFGAERTYEDYPTKIEVTPEWI